MAGTTTVVLGAGFGGISAANALRESLPKEHRVVLVDRSASFRMGLVNIWEMVGARVEPAHSASIERLRRRGIEVRIEDIHSADAASRSVRIGAETLQPDALICSLGAEYDMAAVPGLEAASQTFFTRPGATRLRGVLERFERGRVLLLIPRLPFKCPPGPYEAMLLIHEYMKRRGIREKCELAAYTVEGAPMATAGPKAGEFVVGQLKERGIEFHPRRNVKEVEPGRRVVRFEDGQEAPFDLLIAVPPHRAASVAREGGFTGSSPWAPVDPVTLNLKAPGAGENVYAIGDVSVVPLPGRFRPETPLVLPKAGVFADAQGEVVGRNLAAILLRKQPEAKFDGRGFCYIELGDKHAVRGDGSFFDAEHPTMTMRAPDMMQFEEKRTWVRDWMKRRLG